MDSDRRPAPARPASQHSVPTPAVAADLFEAAGWPALAEWLFGAERG